MDAIQRIIDEGRPVEPYCLDTNNEETWYKIGVHDGYDHAIEATRKQMLDKIERVINNVLGGYVIRNFHFGDSYSIDKLAKDIRKAMEGQV